MRFDIMIYNSRIIFIYDNNVCFLEKFNPLPIFLTKALGKATTNRVIEHLRKVDLMSCKVELQPPFN